MIGDININIVAVIIICTLIYMVARKAAKGNHVNRFTYVLIALVIIFGLGTSWTKITNDKLVTGNKNYTVNAKSESIMSKSYPESSNLSISTD